MVEYQEVMGETAHLSPTGVGECLGWRGVIYSDHQMSFVSSLESQQSCDYWKLDCFMLFSR
jgi:hypothetical protein